MAPPVHRNDVFPVGRQSIRDVAQINERAGVHQVLAEQQWRRPWLALDGDCLFGFLRAGVVLNRDAFDGLDHPIVASEALPASRSPFVTFFDHSPSIRTEEGVEQVIGVSRQQSSCQPKEVLAGACQHAERVALCCIAGQLVQFICNGVVKPFMHITAHKLGRGHANDLVAVGLPERGVSGCPFLRTFYYLVQAFLLEVQHA